MPHGLPPLEHMMCTLNWTHALLGSYNNDCCYCQSWSHDRYSNRCFLNITAEVRHIVHYSISVCLAMVGIDFSCHWACAKLSTALIFMWLLLSMNSYIYMRISAFLEILINLAALMDHQNHFVAEIFTFRLNFSKDVKWCGRMGQIRKMQITCNDDTLLCRNLVILHFSPQSTVIYLCLLTKPCTVLTECSAAVEQQLWSAIKNDKHSKTQTWLLTMNIILVKFMEVLPASK